MSEELVNIDEETMQEINQATEEHYREIGSPALAIQEPIGCLQLTDEQEHVLYAPPVDTDICIRPDGLIYLPWMEYATRLKEAFGLSWALIPEGEPKLQGDLILWRFSLYIQGQKMTSAYGEQYYRENNPLMTYGDALEGAQSNALMRCCKHIGITLELWKPSFINEWKEKYAEKYQRSGKLVWKKKSTLQEKEPQKEKDPTMEELRELDRKQKEAIELCKKLSDKSQKSIFKMWGKITVMDTKTLETVMEQMKNTLKGEQKDG